jgi:hypothetical protein
MPNLELPFSVKVLDAFPLDAKFMNGNVPYTSIAQANSIIGIGIRHLLLVVNINNVEYHYKDGITDAHLVIKTIDVFSTIIKDSGIARTFSLSDLNTTIVFIGSNPVALTLPTNTSVPLPIGFKVKVIQQGIGVVTSSTTGISVISSCGYISEQGGTRTYIKTDLNTWSIEGDKGRNDSTFTGLTILPSTTSIGAITATIISFLSGLTSNAQSQLNSKLTAPAGILNYLTKSLDSVTVIASRVLDTGRFLGVGVSRSPEKDFTLGNQANRIIGVEFSLKILPGRDLNIEAGSTVDYDLITGFVKFQSSIDPTGYLVKKNKESYAFANGNIYKYDTPSSQFLYSNIAGQISLKFGVEMGNLDIYAGNNINIYKQLGGSGNFILQTPNINLGFIVGIAKKSNDDVYVANEAGSVFLQVGGIGDWVLVETVVPLLKGIIISTLDVIYVYREFGTNQVWKKIGTNPFEIENIDDAKVRLVVSGWAGTNGDIYFCSRYYGAYKQTASAGLYNEVPDGRSVPFGFHWNGKAMVVLPLGEVIICRNPSENTVAQSDLYIKASVGNGLPDLNGGTLRHIAGTGKGNGNSIQEWYTGQKLSSGTVMQALTLRMKLDELGRFTYYSTPVFNDNSSAISGGLSLGMGYRTPTGVKMEVY